ncbi:MAG: ferredoxin [Gammaproteobacteria bacterium]|nr:ferredoxin [Gammaproteobacteria bacterium]
MKVRIDLNICLRAGECYYNHPELFRFSQSGDPEILARELNTPELIKHAKEAAAICPASAIIVED